MTEPQTQNGALVQVQHLKKYFPIRKGVLSREVARVHAVDDVTLSVADPGAVSIGTTALTKNGSAATTVAVFELICTFVEPSNPEP